MAIVEVSYVMSTAERIFFPQQSYGFRIAWGCKKETHRNFAHSPNPHTNVSEQKDQYIGGNSCSPPRMLSCLLLLLALYE